METTTNKPWRPRFTIRTVAIGVGAISLILALVVSSQQRSRGLAMLAAPEQLRDAADLLVANVGIGRRLPPSFRAVEAPPFLDQHFELRQSLTLREIADGQPAVVVRSRSNWLLQDASTVKQLAALNQELGRFCREMLEGKPSR